MNTISLEADTERLIDKSLENLGWTLIGENKNVYFQQPKTEKERKLLDGKRPDYILYSKDEHGEHKPIIIIEAKRKGERLDKALEQGIYYAKLLDVPVVIATDGLFCKSYHIKFQKVPVLNGDEVDRFLRETVAAKYFTTWEVNTISQKVQYARRELIKIFDDTNDMLRGDGLRAGIERFGEFANILFLKLVNEDSQYESGKKSNLDHACKWDSIKNIPLSARIDYINNTVFTRLNDMYKTPIFSPLTMRSDEILKEIMDKLDPLTLTDVDSDIKGDAFEYFLRASATAKNDLGEYFTPRHIVKIMVMLINPQIGERIYDPFCGTGGFLIESFRHIWNTMARNDKNKALLQKSTVYGNEITNTARITKMNMILAGDGHSNIYMKDSLANPVDGLYDIVITNMPYSQKTKHGHLYDIQSNNGDSICVQHCMKAINSTAENGRMALVVPEGFLFRKDLSKTRELLLKNCELQSIISLPQGVFLPYTGVKTNILFAAKINQNLTPSQKRKDFVYFNVKSDGYSLDNYRRKLDVGSDLDKYLEYIKLDDNKQIDAGFEFVPLDKVRENDYILLGSRYREQTRIDSSCEYVELKEVAEIIAGQSPSSEYYNDNGDGLPFYQGNANFGDMYINAPAKWTNQTTKKAINGDILLSVRAPVGAVNICNINICIGRGLMAIRSKAEVLDNKYLFYILRAAKEKLQQFSSGSTFDAINKKDVENFKIPIPSFEMQKQIVDELDKYQRIIDGAKQILENYQPFIQIKSDWEIKKLGDLCDINPESIDPKTVHGENEFGYIDISSVENKTGLINKSKWIKGNQAPSRARRLIKTGDILMSTVRPNLRAFGYIDFEADKFIASTGFAVIRPIDAIGKYIYYMLFQDFICNQFANFMEKNMYPSLNKSDITQLKIPIPSLDEQKDIVVQIETEKALIEPNKKIIEVFTKKMQDKINEIWDK